jgi:hypothetical protein
VVCGFRFDAGVRIRRTDQGWGHAFCVRCSYRPLAI